MGTNDSFGMGSAGSSTVQQINGGMQVTTRSITSNLTIDTTTTDQVILADPTNNVITITLPSSSNGRMLVIKDVTGKCAINNITISGTNIDGASTQIMNIAYMSVNLIGTGSGWAIC